MSSWKWLALQDTGRTQFCLPFYDCHPLLTPVPVDRIPVCCTPDPSALPGSEGRMGLCTDADWRSELERGGEGRGEWGGEGRVERGGEGREGRA